MQQLNTTRAASTTGRRKQITLVSSSPPETTTINSRNDKNTQPPEQHDNEKDYGNAFGCANESLMAVVSPLQHHQTVESLQNDRATTTNKEKALGLPGVRSQQGEPPALQPQLEVAIGTRGSQICSSKWCGFCKAAKVFSY